MTGNKYPPHLMSMGKELQDLEQGYRVALLIKYEASKLGRPAHALEYTVNTWMHELINLRARFDQACINYLEEKLYENDLERTG